MTTSGDDTQAPPPVGPPAPVAGGRDHVDAIVLGAGISGLVSASVLLQQGARSVLVVDEYPRVGGNHIDRTIGGSTFDIGSLIFQDDSPLLAHFPELLPHYVEIDPSWGRLNPQGVVTEYPFSVRDDIVAAGPLECARLVASALLARLRRRPPANARQFAEKWLGRRFVARSGLENYMERFCGLPAEEIDLEFAQSRMMWIAEHASASGLLRRLTAPVLRPGGPPPRSNRQLARPRAGFAPLYAPAVEQLLGRGVRFALGRTLESVTRHDGVFTVSTDEGSTTTPRVVSTIPLERALTACRLHTEGPPLPSVALISLFFSFEGTRGFTQPVLYNFAHEGAWKRLTVYSDFYGRDRGREYFGVEVLASSVDGSVEGAEADFRRHSAGNGLLTGDLRLEGTHVLTHAYPLYTRGSGETARLSVRALREFGIESLGRQGAFQYQPTARHSTLEAEAALAQSPGPPTAPDRGVTAP